MQFYKSNIKAIGNAIRFLLEPSKWIRLFMITRRQIQLNKIVGCTKIFLFVDLCVIRTKKTQIKHH